MRISKSPLNRLLTIAVLCSPCVTSAQETVLAGWNDFSAGYQLYKWSGSAKPADTSLSGVTGNLWGGDGTMSIRVSPGTVHASINPCPQNLIAGPVLHQSTATFTSRLER